MQTATSNAPGGYTHSSVVEHLPRCARSWVQSPELQTRGFGKSLYLISQLIYLNLQRLYLYNYITVYQYNAQVQVNEKLRL